MGWNMGKTTVGFVVFLLAVGMVFLFRGGSQPVATETSERYVVTDGAGRQVEIPRRPQRVVALNASNLEIYYAVGGSVVGRATTETLPSEVKKALIGVPEVGIPPNPNIEQIIALKPDLVLGVNLPFHHNLIPVLDKAGIPILLQTVDYYQQILDTIRFYGELAGESEKAEVQIASIQLRYKQIIDKNKNQPVPKVIIVWGSPESFNMATDNTLVGDLVNRLGAINLASRHNLNIAQMGYVPLSMEYVARENPDMILFIAHSSDEKVGEKLQNELGRHPAWQGLKAVRNNKIYHLPYHLFAINPGSQVGESLAVLADLLYPEVAVE